MSAQQQKGDDEDILDEVLQDDSQIEPPSAAKEAEFDLHQDEQQYSTL